MNMFGVRGSDVCLLGLLGFGGVVIVKGMVSLVLVL